jgi:hypothetical protein
VAVDTFEIEGELITTWRAYLALESARQFSDVSTDLIANLEATVAAYTDAWTSPDTMVGREQITGYAAQNRAWIRLGASTWTTPSRTSQRTRRLVES